ncbi:MAG: type II secretion system protein GspG [Lentisphaeraceae bacterium]|nr:type II secretion system protein GspG [Lentisphaeraceae bacterium]
MKKNRFLIIVFVIVTTAVAIGFLGLRNYSEFKVENYLKPAIARNDIIKIMTAVLIYEQEQGLLPSQEEFQKLHEYQPETSVVYQIPPQNDPWGNPYIYKTPGPQGLPYRIMTLGADNKVGGVGKDEDLVSDHVYLKYKDELNNSTSPEDE